MPIATSTEFTREEVRLHWVDVVQGLAVRVT
jgi:hypothetical protein